MLRQRGIIVRRGQGLRKNAVADNRIVSRVSQRLCFVGIANFLANLVTFSRVIVNPHRVGFLQPFQHVVIKSLPKGLQNGWGLPYDAFSKIYGFVHVYVELGR